MDARFPGDQATTTRSIGEVVDGFLAGDYRNTVFGLEDLLVRIRAGDFAPPEIALVTRSLATILYSAERIHDAHVQRNATGNGNIHHHTRVIRTVAEAIDALAAIAGEPSSELILLSAEVHYLLRDLDQAIAILAANRDRFADDGRAMQLLTTCYMLNDQPEEACRSIAIALDFAPSDPENLRLSQRIAELRKTGGRRRIVSGRWPLALTPSTGREALVRETVLAENPFDRPLLDEHSRVVTVGSCFANKLAVSFKQFGRDAFALPFGEEVNNTYTNRLVFEAVAGGVDARDAAGLSKLGMAQDSLDTFADYLRTSDVLVYTLGISQGFSDRDGNPVLVKGFGGVDRRLLKSADYRDISVAENVTNLRAIIAGVRRINADIAIVISVSPVPLARTFNSRAVAVSDCLSESTLRVAAAELTQDKSAERIFYWPSFEIAKWLAPHIAVDAPAEYPFGAEDLYSRHVSDQIVAMIVGLFLEYASGGGAACRTALAAAD